MSTLMLVKWLWCGHRNSCSETFFPPESWRWAPENGALLDWGWGRGTSGSRTDGETVNEKQINISISHDENGISVGRYEFMVFVWINGSFDGVDLGEYCINLLKIDYAVLIMVLGSGTTVTGSWMPWCAHQYHCAHRRLGLSTMWFCVKK